MCEVGFRAKGTGGCWRVLANKYYYNRLGQDINFNNVSLIYNPFYSLLAIIN